MDELKKCMKVVALEGGATEEQWNDFINDNSLVTTPRELVKKFLKWLQSLID